MVMSKTVVPERSEVPKEHTWNAESVFADLDAWEQATEDLKAMLPEIQKYKGKLSESAATLADFIEVQQSAYRLLMKIYFYANMSAAVDANDTRYTAMVGKAGGLYGQLAASASFANPEMLAIGKETLMKWTDEEPRLSHMKHAIDDLFRQQKHILSGEVEQVLGMASEPFQAASGVYGQLTSADMVFSPAVDSDGGEHDLTQSSRVSFMGNPDRELRRSAYDNFTDVYLAHKNTIAATYTASVKQDVFNMRVRGYPSSLEASLFSNNIPVEVFNNLIDTFKKNIPTWHKYWAVRRKALGLDTLRPYDIWAPIAKDVKVTYKEAVDWVANGMKPLGDDYVNAMVKGCLEDRWVDIYPNKGKRAGAFSYGTYDTFPFIMMSFDDSMGGFSTLAHELGHSMHSYLTRKNQPFDYGNYSLFVAEVASNFNQAMSRAYLREAKKDDANFQIALIEEAMANFHRYFFIMPTLARFELEVHERVERGQGVTAESMIDLMTELFKEGYGDEMEIDHDRVGITWATFGHLYSAFYVYQYATGISAAHALADKVLNEGQDAATKYVEFLSAGSSVYPLDALLHAGVDMREPDAVETTFGVLADMVDRLEELTS